jgi:folate-binding protein YgfZ
VLLEGAAIVAHRDPGVIRVAGSDRASWLQGLLSNDIEALTPGRGCYAVWLTPQGRMLTDAVVLAEDDSLTVEVPGILAEQVSRQFDAAIFAEDVTTIDETGTWRAIGIHGQRAAAVVARTLVASHPSHPTSTADMLQAWPEYSHTAVAHLGRLFRASTYGVPGFVLRVPAGVVDLWMSRLRFAGGTLVTAESLEFARIEAGRPTFLVDMDADTIPLEAGIEDRAISFTKGCYVGQEVIVRIVHRGGGRVVRKLVGLTLDGPCVPTARASVKGGRREIGRVTSAAWSPRQRCSVALAYVHRDFVSPGTAVAVQCGGDDVAATVRPLPMG